MKVITTAAFVPFFLASPWVDAFGIEQTVRMVSKDTFASPLASSTTNNEFDDEIDFDGTYV